MEDLPGKIYCQNFKTECSDIMSPCISSATGQVYYRSLTLSAQKTQPNRFLSKPLKKDDLEYIPRILLVSLRECCMNYVVKNVHLVDTLDGFPELVAKELFDECTNFGYFQPDTNGNWLKILHLFTATYGSALLQSLNLSGRWLFLSSHIDTLTPYECLTFIDFSDCRIGDDHDVLGHIGSLHVLKKLFLQNNCISIDGIKLLTRSHRRKSTGLQKLEVLRLDGNCKITLDILPYFKSLASLEVIVVSNSPEISKSDRECCAPFSLCPHSIRFHQKEWANSVVDLGEGWAVPLIKSYLTEMEENLQRKQCKTKLVKGKPNFYAKRKTVSIPNIDPTVACRNHLIICKCSKNRKIQSVSVKRPFQSVAVHANQSKKKCTKNLSTPDSHKKKLKIDQNILDLYM